MANLQGGRRSRRHGALGVLARRPQPADSAGVCLELVGHAGAVLLLELCHGPVDELVVEVLTAQVGVASCGLHLLSFAAAKCENCAVPYEYYSAQLQWKFKTIHSFNT